MKLTACVWSLSVLICMNKPLKMNNPTVNIKVPLRATIHAFGVLSSH